MRFTYYAATVFLISTVYAVPIDNIASTDSRQIDVHARRLPSPLKQLQTYVKKQPTHKSLPAHVKTSVGGGSSTRSSAAMDRNVGHSVITITFWTAEQYRGLQGMEAWKNINIRDTPCTSSQTDGLKPLIESLITESITKTKQAGTPGLRPKPGNPKFEFTNNCLAQWLPEFNIFEVEVKNGDDGGKCREEDDEECSGWIVNSKRGTLMQDGDPKPFYDTTTSEDDQVLERHQPS